MPKHITKRSQVLVDQLCESAKHHGWQEDQGNGKAVTNAAIAYDIAKSLLINRISYLEKKAKKQ